MRLVQGSGFLRSSWQQTAVHGEWNAAGVKIVSEPEDRAWKLRECKVADRDGNLIRCLMILRARCERHTSRGACRE
jgi:hypothetical protein